MPRLTIWRRSRKAGLPPGTLVHIGEKKVEKVRITVIDYDETRYEEREAESIEECFAYRDKPTVTWINIDGVHDVDMLKRLGDGFGMHPLVLEDILNTDQRPKFEDHGDYLFIVLKMLQFGEEEKDIKVEQVSLIVGQRLVISFQEGPGDVFNPIRDRLRSKKGRIRNMGADYLAYTLMDAVIDGYFFILEGLGERLEALENELIDNPTPDTLHTIHTMKREMLFLRKSVWPLREVVSGFERVGPSLLKKSTHIYLRDVYDHTIQVIDTVETFRDMLTGMLDIYLSSLSNRMNQVMKVLTVIATIFIPLTFIAGVYGMNFRYMPELEWRWGYFTVLAVMGAVGILMAAYFWSRRWL